MVIFESKLVRVSNGDWMLGPHDKLVRVAWVLIIMNDIGDKNTENVYLFELVLEITLAEQIVHGLQRIDNMHLAVVRILLEVALSHLFAKVEADLLFYVVR